MRLRLIESRDLDVVRELRNRNRAAFFQHDEITPVQQREWFSRLQSSDSRFYVIEKDDHVVGTISVTETPDGREIGNLILDDPYRGQGLMAHAVAELTKAPGTYFARVKPGNEDSLRVFERAGFTRHHVYLERRTPGRSRPPR